MKMKPLKKFDLAILELAHIECIAISLFELYTKWWSIRAINDSIQVSIPETEISNMITEISILS